VQVFPHAIHPSLLGLLPQPTHQAVFCFCFWGLRAKGGKSLRLRSDSSEAKSARCRSEESDTQQGHALVSQSLQSGVLRLAATAGSAASARCREKRLVEGRAATQCRVAPSWAGLFFDHLPQAGLPMPASPLSSTTWPCPSLTCSQRFAQQAPVPRPGHPGASKPVRTATSKRSSLRRGLHARTSPRWCSRPAAPHAGRGDGGEGDRWGRPCRPRYAKRSVSKTDGVPLFVEELTKMVLESGLLREEDGRYVGRTAVRPSPAAIPATLQGFADGPAGSAGPRQKRWRRLVATLGRGVFL